MQESQMAGALNCSRYLALVFGAGSCLPARTDLSVFTDVTAEQLCIYIIDDDIMVGAELADARLRIETPSAALGICG